MNVKNAFAKIDEAEMVALPDADVSKFVGAATVIAPVPAHAPPVEQAVLSLGRRKPDHLWKYVNGNGELVFAVARWNDAAGKKVSFLPISWVRDADGSEGFAFKHQIAPRPLYGLLDLRLRPDAPVVVVEGEKCADAARGVFPEAVVITSPGGSNAANKADWTPLRGRARVVLWGDADDAGLKYAQDVAQNVAGLDVGEVLIVDSKKLASTTSNGASRSPVPGWDVADALTEGWQPDELRKAVFEHASRHQGIRKFLSFGSFAMNEKGLTVEVPSKGKDAEPRIYWISGPFEILGRIRDPKGEGWARLLRWRDDDGREHTQSISDADLHGDPKTLCALLAHRGLKVATGPTRSHLLRYLNEARVEGRVTVVSRTGWHEIGDGRVFVLPGETIGSVKDETVIVQGATTAPFEKRGSLADWQKDVGSLVGGHSLGVFAVSVAFAGPLLGLLGLEGGGFHFYGQSSRGKSTLVEAAASVWGKGAVPGFVRPWRTTANALEGAAAIHSDALLVLDELGMIDPREAAAAAYQLAAGSGKGRSSQDGSLRTSQSWRTMVISTGEVCLSDKLQEVRLRARAGQQVRLVDIAADAGAGFGVFDHLGADGDAQLLADSIKKAARLTYGHAGPEFVRLLLAHGVEPAVIMAMVEAFRVKFAPKGADGQVLRVCDRFGLVAAAGELAREFGIVSWTAGSVLSAAGKCFNAWLVGRGGSEASTCGHLSSPPVHRAAW